MLFSFALKMRSSFVGINAPRPATPPFHPETNGKPERHHQTIKQDVNQVPYDVPVRLGRMEAAFSE